ncbi:hypothetical protein FOPPYZMZ_CDS0382 [Pseudomonas phage 9Ps-7B]|nr:hypothetical protein [Pseudomonas phage PhiPizzaParty]WRQ05817.1 hypothetical protein IPCDMZAV_CDS0294 [Pseudomonas phage 6B]WRQ06314.1 hypothetical protein QAMIJHJT_CDS0383 [Pseudomonas phage 9-Ps-8B]WRQ06722.1 hypothetical protein FOPPYZMZ_CDS0382 [Pseudomonas phage 9Ps-7B]WRQ07073.1 hypothetical protein ZBUARNPM_CDS0324 [Pseudomonas phage 14Ps5-6]
MFTTYYYNLSIIYFSFYNFHIFFFEFMGIKFESRN